MRKALILLAMLIAAPVSAQLPGLSRRGQPPQPVQNPIDLLRTDFAMQSGGTTVYFAPGNAQLTAQARTILAGQAAWLRQHPTVAVRIEGHGDPTDTRDHALALGARRAGEARDYLLLMGIPAAQVSTMTWGKERPGPPSAVTTIAQ
jgi:peptidoglycan-associated lipoprotein